MKHTESKKCKVIDRDRCDITEDGLRCENEATKAINISNGVWRVCDDCNKKLQKLIKKYEKHKEKADKEVLGL